MGQVNDDMLLPEDWYIIAYLDGYLAYMKPQLVQEIADLIYRENPLLKHMREAGIERQRNREAFKKAVKGKGWR
jgi:hypothetical protein